MLDINIDTDYSYKNTTLSLALIIGLQITPYAKLNNVFFNKQMRIRTEKLTDFPLLQRLNSSFSHNLLKNTYNILPKITKSLPNINFNKILTFF